MPVIESLFDSHFEDADIDIIAEETPEGAEFGGNFGAIAGGAGGLLAGLGLMAIPGLGEVIVGGWLIAGAVGLVAGAAAGMAAGSLLAEPDYDARLDSMAKQTLGTLYQAVAATRRPPAMNFASLS